MNKCLASTGLAAALLLGGSALGSASVCGPATAHALSLYAGALGGYAVSTDENHSVNPFGVGLGASAGLSLPVVPIYVGGRFLYYFGESASFSDSGVGLKLDSHYLIYGIDLGYDAELGPIVLRPGLGLGRATLKTSTIGVDNEASLVDSSFFLAPSIGLIIKLGLLYVSGELRYNALTESDQPDSVSLLAGLGLTI